MEIQAQAALMIQANALDAVRSTLTTAQAAPATPEAQADVILQLSTAAQQLLVEADIARSHAAFIGAAVTEIASFRAQLSGPQLG
jgi:hypothetical protein